MFRPMIRSRHGSHGPLRTKIQKLPFRSVVRLGSTTDVPDSVTNGGRRIECNTIQAVRNSASKRLMKERFKAENVKTADWWTEGDLTAWAKERYPIVAKHIHGSRGTGNYLLHDSKELDAWIKGKTIDHYIFERFYNYVKEYRLHVTNDGCFYTCRKMLKEDTPKENRWYRNDSNSVWMVEENPLFDKPNNWKEIEAECVKALNAVGLDVCACDVKVQSSKERKKDPEFIILETNSAPSFAEITLEKYLNKIPQILNSKYGNGKKTN